MIELKIEKDETCAEVWKHTLMPYQEWELKEIKPGVLYFESDAMKLRAEFSVERMNEIKGKLKIGQRYEIREDGIYQMK